MRLGFACKVLGADIPSHDTRRWQSSPHLSVSLGYLDRMFDYLADHQVSMYRMSSNVAPYFTDVSRPQFAGQLRDCTAQLRALGEKARDNNLRLSTHPSQYVVLNSPDETVYRAAVRELEYHADLLDLMDQPSNAKMVLHVGGVYGERPAALERWVQRHEQLPSRVRARLVVENDDKSYGIDDVLYLHAQTGVPVVFDVLHHSLFNPSGMSEADALERSLDTWPMAETPKVHYSEGRSEPRLVKRQKGLVEVPPARGQHADYVNAEQFLVFLQQARGRLFDIMLEAKAKDLALFRLRDQIRAKGIARVA